MLHSQACSATLLICGAGGAHLQEGVVKWKQNCVFWQFLAKMKVQIKLFFVELSYLLAYNEYPWLLITCMSHEDTKQWGVQMCAAMPSKCWCSAYKGRGTWLCRLLTASGQKLVSLQNFSASLPETAEVGINNQNFRPQSPGACL